MNRPRPTREEVSRQQELELRYLTAVREHGGGCGLTPAALEAFPLQELQELNRLRLASGKRAHPEPTPTPIAHEFEDELHAPSCPSRLRGARCTCGLGDARRR